MCSMVKKNEARTINLRGAPTCMYYDKLRVVPVPMDNCFVSTGVSEI